MAICVASCVSIEDINIQGEKFAEVRIHMLQPMGEEVSSPPRLRPKLFAMRKGTVVLL